MFTWENVTVLDRDWEDEYNEYLNSQPNADHWEEQAFDHMINPPDLEDEMDCLLREYGI